MSDDINKNCRNHEICPETVPDEQIGATEEERRFALKKDPRPPVPRYVFAAIAAVIVIAFVGGSFWYYRTNVLPEKYYQKATALFKQHEYENAAIYYAKVMNIRPERKDVLYQLAVCLEETGKTDAAIARYEEHLKVIPGDVKALTRLGWLYMQKGEYERALKVLRDAVKKERKKPELWEMIAKASLKQDDIKGASESFANLAALYTEPEKVMECAKKLMELASWEGALGAYERAAALTDGSASSLHGVLAAKTMLGYPTDPKLTIAAGKSIGLIKLDYTKAAVKEVLGTPDRKDFVKIEEDGVLSKKDAEIWTYAESMPKRGMRLIFVGGVLQEAESSSSLYKTEKGLSLSNFLLDKNKDKLQERKKAKDGTVICPVKGGGVTFYAAFLNESGTDAKYKKVRLHKGTSSIRDGLSLLDIF